MARVRLMTWNILEGGTGSDGRRLDLVTTVVRAARPDILVTCEAHGFAEEPRLLADVAAAMGMRPFVAPAASGAHVALFVRAPVAVSHFQAGELGGGAALALAAIQAPGLPGVALAGCHLDPFSPDSRASQVASLLARLPAGWPRVVLGDLNQMSHEDGLSRRDLLGLPLHHVERHVGADGEPDTRVTRMLADAGLVDAWRLAHAGSPVSEGFTVPTAIPQPPRFGGMRIDYVFLSTDLPAALTWCDTWREPPAPHASDHLAVVADLEPHAS